MTSRIIALSVGFGIIASIFLWGFLTYNTLVKTNLTVDSQWAQVETQYQRRFDLIPNLVASVQGIFTQEKDVFSAIADARKEYSGSRTIDEKVQAASRVEGSLGRLLVITENYPQLNSNQALQNLMTQLEGAENRVSVERMRFNDSVKAYNTEVVTFPTNIFSKLFGFKERAFFKAVEQASVVPVVKFNQ
jgi:LemA protein